MMDVYSFPQQFREAKTLLVSGNILSFISQPVDNQKICGIPKSLCYQAFQHFQSIFSH